MSERPQSRGCGRPECGVHGIGKCCPCYDPETQHPCVRPCFDRCCAHNRDGHPFVAISGLGSRIWAEVDAVAYKASPSGEARGCRLADRVEY